MAESIHISMKEQGEALNLSLETQMAKVHEEIGRQNKKLSQKMDENIGKLATMITVIQAGLTEMKVWRQEDSEIKQKSKKLKETTTHRRNLRSRKIAEEEEEEIRAQMDATRNKRRVEQDKRAGKYSKTALEKGSISAGEL